MFKSKQAVFNAIEFVAVIASAGVVTLMGAAFYGILHLIAKF